MVSPLSTRPRTWPRVYSTRALSTLTAMGALNVPSVSVFLSTILFDWRFTNISLVKTSNLRGHVLICSKKKKLNTVDSPRENDPAHISLSLLYIPVAIRDFIKI